MLQKTLTFNGRILSDLAIQTDIPLAGGKSGAVMKAGTTLDVLAQLGVRDPNHAPQVLVLLMEELNRQNKYARLNAHRYPAWLH